MVLGDYFETYVQRDLRELIKLKNIQLFEKFVRLAAGRVGQLLNMQSIANDVGASNHTINDWTTLLEVKSAQTVASDAMKPTRAVADILGDRVKDMSLIYGGEEYQKRSDFEVLPYRNLQQWLYS